MYAWIWRHLPGPWPVRLVISLVIVAAIIWVFPWVETTFNINDITVE